MKGLIKIKTFSLLSDLSQFVDREAETEKIIYDIKSSSKSKISIIAANTAIGKSALVQKVFEQLDSNQLKIQVKTLPENIGSNPKEWIYWDNIFDSLNSTCKKNEQNNLTFEYFITNCKSKTIKNEILNNLISSMLKEQSKISVLFVIIIILLKRLLHLDYFDADKLINDNSSETIQIKSHYISYVFKNTNVILNIDNIQNIDTSSLNQLTKLISENSSQNHYYIFEYTFSEKYTSIELQNFQNYLTDCGVSSVTYRLEKIHSDYIVDLVSRHMDVPIENKEFNVKLVQYYNSENSGNLRKLIDFSLNYSDYSMMNNKSLDDPTLINLISLSDNSKYVTAILMCNNAHISISDLQEIAENHYLTLKKLDTVIKELLDKQLISINNGEISIKHASIVDTWKKAKNFYSYNQTAYSDYENFLLSYIKVENKISDEYWIRLLNLYSQYNPRKIDSLLTYIKEKIIGSISPKNAWLYISMLIDETKGSLSNYYNMYFDIVKICFESELYNEGYSCIQLLEDEIPLSQDYNLLLNKCMFLSALDKHEENIKLCERFLGKSNIPKHVYLNLCLIAMSSYRSLNQKAKCLKLFYEIKADKEYCKFKEYGYFLRLTCMYLPIKDRIKHLKKSIMFFLFHREYHQAGKSLISYAYALSSAKKQNHAYRSILLAEHLLKTKQMGQHMFLVNKASILISKGIYDNSVWELLDKAEISATVPFDKIAIIINKLILCIENKDYRAFDYLFYQAKNLVPNEPDKHIHTLIYFNLYRYFKQIGNDEMAQIYYKKAYEIRDWCPSMKKYMDSHLDNKIEPKWYNCYLEYWTYDLFKL